MEKWKCSECGYVYEPAGGDDIPFEQLPDDWICPVCGFSKSVFEKE
jgi:rubredoxin